MQTSRLSIRQIKYPLEDQPYWLNNPRNTTYSEQRHVVHTKESCAEYIRGCDYFWGIQEVDTGEWIGTAACHVDAHNEVANLGILIHHEYASKGFGTEAWAALCEATLKEKGVRKLEAGMVTANKPMIALCKKTGMVFDGERKNQALIDGHLVSIVYYAKWRPHG